VRSQIEVTRGAVGQARQRAAALRRSLFAEAFAGRLVPQDPADEPASILLERIGVERAALPKVRRGRKTVRLASQEETLL
jgi:type I restriction enzyme, S subunit